MACTLFLDEVKRPLAGLSHVKRVCSEQNTANRDLFPKTRNAPAGIRTRVESSGGFQDIHYPTETAI